VEGNAKTRQPDRADARRWLCESSASFAICRTVWMRMRGVSNSRSGTRQRMSTPCRCLQWWLSNTANWESLVSCSEKCFPCSLRPQRAVGTCMVQGYAILRVWVPNVSCYQWTMTLSLGHDLSEVYLCTLAWFLKKKKSVKMSLHHQKKSARAPRAPKCAAPNVWCLLILTVYWAHGLFVGVTCHASHDTLVWVLPWHDR